LQHQHRQKYLAVIAGPTAVGKTDLSIQLAKHYNAVILSADSRQFYKELNIGTAKPHSEQLKEAEHYFINTKSVSELYGAGHYAKDVHETLEQLYKQRHLVFLSGGSGLYIDAVLNGIDDFSEVPADIRTEINQQFKERGLNWLQEEVKSHDPTYYLEADPNNHQRLIRALEVCRFSGKPFSSFLKKHKTERNFIPIKILVNLPRPILYERINERVDRMMDEGLLDEVKNLVSKRQVNALQTVGYKELYQYLEGEFTLEKAVEKIKQHTRNYAKRQLTWFRNKDNFTEFDARNIQEIIHHINAAMEK
jgi:tRNA dimethylallyltransferase